MRLRHIALAAPLLLTTLAVPSDADAFCGFYVAGADAKLFNNATLVVMMRDGTRTVLAMQNNYQGPPENFAMVVPVPIVLQKENVKTLTNDVFDRVDKLAAPRLVEYWEQDPCPKPSDDDYDYAMAPAAAPMAKEAAVAGPRDLGVKIEAQFTVGEYEIVILSAQDSTGLDTWLRENGYKIPAGAEPLLRPYVQSGMKFFVARVNAAKVRFEKGMAMLSPLRFHYDSESFNLPVRLGLVNSAGTQDLIVHILARRQRYELANYKNVTIPTNIDVADSVVSQFGAFYAALFDRTIEQNPGAIVTEYAWSSGSCDPCPTPPLEPGDFTTLGGDVLPSLAEQQGYMPVHEFVLTRLHARYGKDSLGEDLVFRVAPPIVGGREFNREDDRLETGAQVLPEGSESNFQARYAIRHPWTGPIACWSPKRGVWGGPPEGVSGDTSPKAAQNLAFAPRGAVQLASLVRSDVPEIKLVATGPGRVAFAGQSPPSGACAACWLTQQDNSPLGSAGSRHALLAAFAAAIAFALRRKRL